MSVGHGDALKFWWDDVLPVIERRFKNDPVRYSNTLRRRIEASSKASVMAAAPHVDDVSELMGYGLAPADRYK